MPTNVKLPQRDEVKHNPIPPLEASKRAIKYITFFGDSAIREDSPIFKDVYGLAQKLANAGYGIVNGGGPGIMKAATDGAESVNGYTHAVYWDPLLASHFEGKNILNKTDKSDSYSNYMMRTLGLIEHGQVYIVCKGGTGTASEFAMVWALAKLYYGRHKPVILYGDFWKPIIDTFKLNMLIDQDELDVLHFANTHEEVLNLLEAFEKDVQARPQSNFIGDETPFVIDGMRADLV